MIEQKRIAKNLYLCVADRRYKRDKLTIEMASPLERCSITAKVLLPMILSSATSSCPDMVSISRKLDMLYGATLSANAAVYGSRVLLRFDMEGVSDAYLADSNLGLEAAKMLLEVILRPATENGAFLPGVFAVELEKLAELIRAQINNKREYCMKLLRQAFYADDVRGISGSGYEEDLPHITADMLFAVYNELLQNSVVQVFYAGRHEAEIEQLLVSAFAGCFENGAPIKEAAAILPSEPISITETVNIEQDKLALLYHSGRMLDIEQTAALRVANSIFGASPTSRLFMNVREKQSLCYYCASSRGVVSGGMLSIESGVSAQNALRAAAAMRHEFEQLAEYGPTEKELDETKLLLRNLLKGVSDSVGGYASYTLSNIRSLGRPFSQEEELALVEEVSAKDVKELLSSMQYCGSSRLTGEKV